MEKKGGKDQGKARRKGVGVMQNVRNKKRLQKKRIRKETGQSGATLAVSSHCFGLFEQVTKLQCLTVVNCV